jgi:O-acetyl-ADP-ribose deacetylase (regulator of RNase III)
MPLLFVEPQDVLAIEADALVNTVNCFGFMGKGVAKAFAKDKRFNPKKKKGEPQIGLEMDYIERCEQKLVRPGEPYIWDRRALNEPDGIFETPVESPRFVINLPTKNHYANPSKLEWVDHGLQRIKEMIAEHGITSIAMPAPGCGNGGLRWADVKELIERHLGDAEVLVTVVEPQPVYDGFIER